MTAVAGERGTVGREARDQLVTGLPSVVVLLAPHRGVAA
jgi:hypothetical protein